MQKNIKAIKPKKPLYAKKSVKESIKESIKLHKSIKIFINIKTPPKLNKY